MTAAPSLQFSIVIPVLNRAGMILRAVESCLRQDFDSFEVLVVDDGSTDGTAEVVEALGDARVKVLRHPTNQGVCAARNTGIDVARGRWCVFLDSDFQLLDGALSRLSRRCDQAPADVGNLATICTWDHGPDTPSPTPDGDLLLDYEGYLRFCEGLAVSEWFNCIRREVFDAIRYPSGRAYEGGFHLGLAKRYRFLLASERVVKIYTDARDRVTIAPPAAAMKRMLRDAHDSAEDAEQVLAAHGEALARCAPKLRAAYVESAMLHHLLAGERRAALRWVPSLAPARRGVTLAATLALGMVGPLPLAWTRAQWTWRRHRRSAS
jgi:glycosyltransferase involved in cell wall biosynthesis